MAKKALKKPDEKLSSKVDKVSLTTLGKALSFIGKPFYLLIVFAFLTVVYISYITGHFVRVSTTYIGNSLIYLFKLLFKKIKWVRKVKKSKKEAGLLFLFSYLKEKLKITFLKLKLFEIRSTKTFSFKKKAIKIKKPRFSYFFLVSLFLIIAIPVFIFFSVFYKLPSPSDLKERQIEVSTKIYDRNGVLLYTIYKDKNRSIVSLKDIPLHARLATLAIEDAEFYHHPGFSIKGVIRAIINNISKGELSGGSTITQQLVKNALLTSQKTLTRKVKEVVLAILVEMKFNKDEILEMYLNEVSYGGTSYGVEEASQTYFGKSVKEVSLAEAALLAALPKSPSKYSPFGDSPNDIFLRQKDVLRLMRINGFITKEQEEKAKNQKITFAPNRINMKAPHFVMYLRSLLQEKYGEEIVEKGGLEVTTTLDYGIQKMAEEVVKNELEKLKSLNVTNAGVLVLNPKTGEVLAMIGSKDYFDFENDGNVNVTVSLRQPGSSIKIINYSYALSHGYTLASIISDSPVSYIIKGQEPYVPKNYDGTFRGNINLRSALAESRNIPAVKVLASYGVKNMIEQGQKMGITTWNETNRFGLSLTLGGGEVKLIDLARVYATIANFGKRPEITPVIKITNYKGKTLEANPCVNNDNERKTYITKLIKNTYAAEIINFSEISQNECSQEVLDPRVSFLITDILKDNTARSPAFGTNSQLVIKEHPEVAVKTGTSNNLRDNLTIGYSQNYLVAVWVGNNDNSPMARVASGVTGASPIWNKIMTALLINEKSVDWEPPQGLSKVAVCSSLGTLPCEGCQTKTEWFLEENQPKYSCNPQSIETKVGGKPQGEILEPAAKIEVRKQERG